LEWGGGREKEEERVHWEIRRFRSHSDFELLTESPAESEDDQETMKVNEGVEAKTTNVGMNPPWNGVRGEKKKKCCNEFPWMRIDQKRSSISEPDDCAVLERDERLYGWFGVGRSLTRSPQ